MLNVQKTECQYIGREETQLGLNVDGQTLEQKEKFVYLGGLIDSQGGGRKRTLKEESGLLEEYYRDCIRSGDQRKSAEPPRCEYMRRWC